MSKTEGNAEPTCSLRLGRYSLLILVLVLKKGAIRKAQ